MVRRLSDRDVGRILSSYFNYGVNVLKLAQEFKIPTTEVRKILFGEKYQHVYEGFLAARDM